MSGQTYTAQGRNGIFHAQCGVCSDGFGPGAEGDVMGEVDKHLSKKHKIENAVPADRMGASYGVSASLSGGEPAGSPKPSKRLPSVIKRG